MAKDLLFELGTEELPPKALSTFEKSLGESITAQLHEAGLASESIKTFATPRRLAIIVKGLDEQQADKSIEKLGPNIKAAYDSDGNPTKAAEGFAKSNGVSFDQLETTETDKGERLVFRSVEKGSSTES